MLDVLRARRFWMTAGVAVLTGGSAWAEVDYARDIRPILSNRCFACHGFDDKTREADLGLHTFAAATRDLGGYRAVEPGKPDASEVMHRLTTHDADEKMPPASSNKKALSPQEVALVRQWIAEGAKYQEHWAFVPPVKPKVPEMAFADLPLKEGPATEIDAFIRQRLPEHGLRPSAEADRATLLRRVSLDLIGMVPTPAELTAFEKDAS
ncbi:MAG: DUF1549 domain-containing protein, partial [Verrucomicrobiales bacterium]|nr:DUF1549 domain-containing protein [Verrucomicrobiales bacterium]